ncbi:MAG TPA: hypothetical protein VFW64_12300 [Pseudonocardiaceae bacterium]|nr:hypothetical protein [Pseudonocardiaceae bacterium]
MTEPQPHYEARTLREVVAYPPHGPRASDPHYKIFNAAKCHLVHVLGVGCWIGGATLTEVTAGLPAGHRCFGATQIEAHHAVAEFAGLNEVDWQKVAADFPQVGLHSDEDFLRFAESEGGLMILCDKHHRAAGQGIHSVTYPAWLLDRYAEAGWEFLPGSAKP